MQNQRRHGGNSRPKGTGRRQGDRPRKPAETPMPALELHVANRSLAIWWALCALGSFSLVFPGYWVQWMFGQAVAPEVFAMIRAAGAAALVIGLGRASYVRYSALYTVTPDAISARHGIFAHNTNYVRRAHIRTIEVRQSTLGRLLGFGDISFASAGTAFPEVVFASVRSPADLKKRITEVMHQPDRSARGSSSWAIAPRPPQRL